MVGISLFVREISDVKGGENECCERGASCSTAMAGWLK